MVAPTLTLALLLTMPLAPATPVPSGSGPLPPVVWELVALPDGGATPVPATGPAQYTLQFLPGERIAARADCNQVAGTYTLDDDAIDLTLTASTLALCPPGSRADDFQRALASAQTMHEDDNGDLLLAGAGGTMRLRPSLAGVVWEWQRFQGGDDSVATPKNPERYTLSFLPEGMLAIQADCNRAIGRYTTDGPRIDIAVGGVTRKLCPPGSLMDDYLRDLAMASSHVFRNGNLYLVLPADAGNLEFVARSVAPGRATPQPG